jgi:very-short-patch-repair endonuclease
MATRPPDWTQELIDRQQGVIARWQLRGLAADLSAADSLLRSGRWQWLYRGVYGAYTGEPSRTSILWAAVRRCGPGAALSHFTAAELDRIIDERGEAIHVSIPETVRIRFAPREFGNGLPRIIVHRSPRLAAATHPARTPPRTRIEETVLDMTHRAQNFDVAFSWLSAACGRRLSTPEQLREAADSRPRLRWRTDVLEALTQIAAGVLSNLERQYLRNVERPHRLPRPRRQARMRRGTRSAYLDNLYEEFGLGVELDGLASHRAETRWRDIHRDNYLAGAGIITLRYNWADVTKRPCQVAAEIALALRQRGWTGTLRRCPECPEAAAQP